MTTYQCFANLDSFFRLRCYIPRTNNINQNSILLEAQFPNVERIYFQLHASIQSSFNLTFNPYIDFHESKSVFDFAEKIADIDRIIVIAQIDHNSGDNDFWVLPWATEWTKFPSWDSEFFNTLRYFGDMNTEEGKQQMRYFGQLRLEAVDVFMKFGYNHFEKYRMGTWV